MNQPKLTRIAIKSRAKMLLFSNLGKCVTASVISASVGLLAGFLSSMIAPLPDMMSLMNGTEIAIEQYMDSILFMAAVGLLVSIITCPLTMGMYEMFTHLVRDEEAHIGDIFSWFGEGKRLAKALGANLWYMLITFGWMILCTCVPIALLLATVFNFFMETLLEVGILAIYLVALILYLIGMIYAVYRTIYYTVALYMIAAEPERKVRETFRECKRIMKNRKGEFFMLNLSFIGWQMLAAFTCGLSIVFVTPYMNLSFAQYTHRVTKLADYVEPEFRYPPYNMQ